MMIQKKERSPLRTRAQASSLFIPPDSVQIYTTSTSIDYLLAGLQSKVRKMPCAAARARHEITVMQASPRTPHRDLACTVARHAEGLEDSSAAACEPADRGGGLLLHAAASLHLP